MSEPGAIAVAPALPDSWMRGIEMPERMCSVDGCERPRRKREWCNTHYEHWRRYGMPTRKPLALCTFDGCLSPREPRKLRCAEHAGKRMDSRRLRPLVERFMERVEVAPTGCWLWKAAIDREGYGRSFLAGARSQYAHRVAHEFFVGPIAEGMQIDHLCHAWDVACPGGPACLHRRCVNPEHLEAVTGLENTRRASPATKTHCKYGHEFTPENTYRNTVTGRRACLTCKRIRSKGGQP